MSYPWLHLIDAAWPRFIAKVHAPDPLGCWPWLGARSCGKGNTAPYGSFNVGKGFIVRAHIFSCAAAGMEVEPGHHRDHFSCAAGPLRTLCINPAHFDPVTPTINSHRRWKR